jgi:hypothetical protein
MMKRILVFSLVLVLAAVSFTAAMAQEEPDLPVCPDGVVSGTVVGYDEETGEVILDVEGELCVVTMTSEYEHPIVNLLGVYFKEIEMEEIGDALGATQVCLIDDGDGTYTVAEPVDGVCAEGDLVTVTGLGDEGGFEGVDENGDPVSFDLDDEEAAAALADALDTLQNDWDVKDGAVGDVGADIAAYHDDGYGFGVLVKVYAIADEAKQACGDQLEEVSEGEIDPCDVSVDHLLEEFKGMGMGQIFQVYGKPSIVGIGHVRQLSGDNGSAEGGDNGAKGICNARAHGGNAKANGKADVNCGDADADGDADGGEGTEGDG